jgi:hypothetical protein
MHALQAVSVSEDLHYITKLYCGDCRPLRRACYRPLGSFPAGTLTGVLPGS